MPSTEQAAQTYQQLAEGYERRGDGPMRDRFLVLAASSWYAAGKKDEAERLRTRLLQRNPHHLFKPFDSMDQAMRSADVQNYVDGLRRHYPPETATPLLESLGQGPAPGTGASVSDRLIPDEVKLADIPPDEAAGTYRVRHDNRESTERSRGSRPPKAPLAGPTGPQVRARPVERPRAPREPDVYALQSTAETIWTGTGREGDESQGAWLPMLLFGVLLLTALAWLGYVVSQVFLVR